MAATATLIPLEEYLRTVYHPDRDYIDGEVIERNMGEKPHSRLQTFFSRFFAAWESECNFETLPEQRIQVGLRRYRIPDIALISLSDLDTRIVRTPPLLCIEILSSEDRMRDIQARLDDYAAMGVQCMWVVDPWRYTAFAAGPDAILHPATDTLTVPGTPIRIAVSEIFAELDRLARRAAAPTSPVSGS